MSKTNRRWLILFLLPFPIRSARTHEAYYERPPAVSFTLLVQTSWDLAELQGYYQEAQEQLQAAGLSRAEQHRLLLEQAAYLEKMRCLASFQPFAVSREIAAFLLAHETDGTDPLQIRDRW